MMSIAPVFSNRTRVQFIGWSTRTYVSRHVTKHTATEKKKAERGVWEKKREVAVV